MKKRCAWANKHPAEMAYHDYKWGVPLHNDYGDRPTRFLLTHLYFCVVNLRTLPRDLRLKKILEEKRSGLRPLRFSGYFIFLQVPKSCI